MSDYDKSKKELIEELEALRAKVPGAGDEVTATDAGVPSGGITRREILSNAWVAPVILTVPLGVSLTERAHAQVPTLAPAPTSPPTLAPTSPPTLAPTLAPTPVVATPAPSTLAPTAVPATLAPTAPVPTAFPTVATGADPIPVEISDFDVS